MSDEEKAEEITSSIILFLCELPSFSNIFVYLFVCLFVCLLVICLFVDLFVCLFICPRVSSQHLCPPSCYASEKLKQVQN